MPKKENVYDEAYVRELSKLVYVKSLSAHDRQFMIDECARKGVSYEKTLNTRAQAYDGLTRKYLDALHEYGKKK